MKFFYHFALVWAESLLHTAGDACHSEVNAPSSFHTIKTLKQKHKDAPEGAASRGLKGMLCSALVPKHAQCSLSEHKWSLNKNYSWSQPIL